MTTEQTSTTEAASLGESALQRPVRPLRRTRGREHALGALLRREITHPGPGIANALEKAGAIRWVKGENRYVVTDEGAKMHSEWTEVCVVRVPADWLRPNSSLSEP